MFGGSLDEQPDNPTTQLPPPLVQSKHGDGNGGKDRLGRKTAGR